VPVGRTSEPLLSAHRGLIYVAILKAMIEDHTLSRILRWIGWITWLSVGFPIAAAMFGSAGGIPPTSVTWLVAFVAFGPAFALASTWTNRRVWQSLHVPALAIAALAPLVMIGLNPGCFAGALLVIVAWQVAIQLDTTWALTWVATQSALLSLVVMVNSPNSRGISSSIIFSVFQFFAFCTAYLTLRETKARDALLRSNSELKSTQLLLAHSSRIGERVRISRELHDVLGHDLTALSLHLEIARNTDDAQRDVEKAQLLAKGLLAKVREVVTLMRSDDELRIVPLLKGLAAEEPKLKVHLKADEGVDALDSGRAHTLLRCVQEAITNARVHSGANNLWLDIYRQGDNVVAQARDDGRGTPSPSSQSKGHGLMGIQERLEEFGGTMVVTSSPGEGFCLHVVLPLGYS